MTAPTPADDARDLAAAVVITAVAEVIPGQPTQQADEEET